MPSAAIEIALQEQMSDEIKIEVELVQVSKILNISIGTTYYNPQTLRNLSQIEIDNLVMACVING